MSDPTTLDRRRLLAFTLGAGLATQAHGGAQVPLFVGTDPPSAQTSQMLAWLARKMELAWDYRPTPWLRAQKLAAAGQGLMWGLSRTPLREKELQFSLPIWSNHTWAIVRDGDQAAIRRFGDLNGQTVCWARGSSYGEMFTRAGLGRMHALEAGDDDGALRMTAAGRCRAALITLDMEHAGQVGRYPTLANLQARGLALVPVAMAPTSLHFATGHGSRWAWVIARINQVASRSRGELQRMRSG
jgi:hypothetical protein